MPKKNKQDVQVSFEETMRARQIFFRYVDDFVITKITTFRTILADIGEYPSQDELLAVLDVFNGKIKFDNFLKYMNFLKKEFLKPEPKDADTLSAYIAIGGARDRTGAVDAQTLANTVRAFKLTIDIDRMIAQADGDGNGNIEYDEFEAMWEDVADPSGVSSGGMGDSPSTALEKSQAAMSASMSFAEESTKTDDERIMALRSFLVTTGPRDGRDGMVGQGRNLYRRASRRMSRSGAGILSNGFGPGGAGGAGGAGSAASGVYGGATGRGGGRGGAETRDGDGQNGGTGDHDDEDQGGSGGGDTGGERLPPISNDPMYNRYLGTQPATLGLKKPGARGSAGNSRRWNYYYHGADYFAPMGSLNEKNKTGGGVATDSSSAASYGSSTFKNNANDFSYLMHTAPSPFFGNSIGRRGARKNHFSHSSSSSISGGQQQGEGSSPTNNKYHPVAPTGGKSNNGGNGGPRRA